MNRIHDLKIIVEHQCAIIVMNGECRAEDAVALFQQLMAHPDYTPDLCGVIDLRRAVMAMPPEDAEQLGKLAADMRLSSGRWAYIADNPVTTALALIYKDHVSQSHDGAIFSTLPAASDYLGVDLSPYLPA